MSGDFKPGDRVRVTEALLVRDVGKASAFIAGHSLCAWVAFDHLEPAPAPAPAAPAAEPEMREEDASYTDDNGTVWTRPTAWAYATVCQALHAAEARALAAEAALAAVKQAVRDYHLALDTRQHGGVAGHRLVDAVQDALGMPWQQGAELRSRAITAEGADTGEGAK